MSKKISEDTAPEISRKSSKEAIYDAYQQALKKLAAKPIEPSVSKQKEKEVATVEKASQRTADSTVKDFADLKINLLKQIDVLSEQMVNACHQLKDIQQAIAIEKAHLDDLYAINETAQTLAALMHAQQEQKENFAVEMQAEKDEFEREMEQRKIDWKEQQGFLTLEYKERKEQLEKDRKREEEEYKYNLDLKRRKEADVYSAQKTALEKELEDLRHNLDERELGLKNKEAEFVELRHKVELFPAELIKAREEAEQALRAKLESQFKFAKELREKEVVGENKLNAQTIAALENKIKEQAQLISQLTQKADAAVNQIQLIACRALDTSAQRFGSQFYQEEKAKEKSSKEEK